MGLTDTHSHIYLDDFKEDLTDVILRARYSGVDNILLPNIDLDSIEDMHRLVDAYPGFCFPMMGLHPTSVDSNYQENLKTIRSCFDARKYVAVGEIGVDLYWDKTHIKEQKFVFEEQLRWSIELDLPVVIHTRDAFPEVMECLQNVGISKLRGVFHSFGGSLRELEQVLACENFLIGINGVVTFKKAEFREYLNIAPIERIVVETDAPYLTPVPFRGKRNEPAYIVYTVEKLAEIYQVTPKTIEMKTSENALRMFRL